MQETCARGEDVPWPVNERATAPALSLTDALVSRHKCLGAAHTFHTVRFAQTSSGTRPYRWTSTHSPGRSTRARLSPGPSVASAGTSTYVRDLCSASGGISVLMGLPRGRSSLDYHQTAAAATHCPQHGPALALIDAGKAT